MCVVYSMYLVCNIVFIAKTSQYENIFMSYCCCSAIYVIILYYGIWYYIILLYMVLYYIIVYGIIV